MAIPFVLPLDEDDGSALEQIFNHIHELLRLLQQQIQSRQAREELGASSRVRSSSSSRRTRDDQRQPAAANATAAATTTATTTATSTISPADLDRFPEFVTHRLALLTSTRGGGDLAQLAASRRRRRRRTGSESSCCDDGKPLVISSSVDVGVTVHWPQEEEQAREQTKGGSSCSSEGLLSKLVPPPISGSIWTAVICVVGWHLLRTR